jgi:type II secretory pathway pseudopilin PulG
MAIAIFVVVFAMLFPALRLYMEQQAQEAALKAQLESALHQLEESAAELKRWDDPAYIKVQARQRLSFAMPGDRTFRVSDPENAPSSVSTGQPSQPPSEAVPPDGSRADQADPWYAVLWRSMLAAGQTGQADQTSRTGQTGQR